jgi:predicted CXXCH cytochrome family protein
VTFRSMLVRAAAVVAVLAGAGCTTEKIVFQDRDPFNPPPDRTNGFLGYYTVPTQQTTCGNCHAGFQGKWKQTAHAKAYSTLATLPAGRAQDFCYNCHTVSSRGNAAASPAGWEAVKDSAYRDVQCESCHGPGLPHVQGVGQGTLVRPLAKVSMTGDGTCGDCHSGAHHPFVEEWSQSGHAVVNTYMAGNTSSGCASCHDGRGALKAWGVESNYQERDNATAYQATTCAVCHDPHGGPNAKQLRFPVDTPDPERNLCMKCHMRRNEPTFTQSSPHAPQGAVLLGTGGYRPAGFSYDEARVFGSHATDRNPKLCAGCHVASFTVNDPQGNFVFQATGHLFRALPCLDANGKPTADENCAYTSTARAWGTCTSAGCHANAGVAASLFTTVRNRLKMLTDQLWVDSNGNRSMQAAPTDAGMLPTVRQMRPSEWSTTDNRVTPAEGAEFNARLCGEYGQSTADNSKGVHNPFLCEALLIATINEIRTFYGLPSPPAAVLEIMNGPLGGPFAGNVKISTTPVIRTSAEH